MARHSYNLRTPVHLLEKISRDLIRFHKSADPSSRDYRYQSDHAMNFVISAWHMIEWLYRSDSIDIPKVSACKTFEEFRDLVLQECPDLKICRELANGAKHFVLRENDDYVVSSTAKVPSVVKILRSAFNPAESRIFVVRKSDGSPPASLIIELTNGKHKRALSVFEGVLDYWDQLIGSAE
jgi:hypothetical protein